MSTLTDGVTTIELPDSLQWVDEFDFVPIAVKSGRTLTGALWVEECALTGGRPITLQGGNDFAWVSREDVAALHEMAATPGAELTLTLRGDDYDVMFDREQGKAVDSRPIVGYEDVDGLDPHYLTLRLRTI